MHPPRTRTAGARRRATHRPSAKLLFAPADAATAQFKRRTQRHASRRLELAASRSMQIKAIAHAQKATVNDVLLAAVSGALRRYLQEHDGPVAEIHAIVPFNLRPLDKPIPRDARQPLRARVPARCRSGSSESA